MPGSKVIISRFDIASSLLCAFAGSGLVDAEGYKEYTNEWICLEYSTANCTVYWWDLLVFDMILYTDKDHETFMNCFFKCSF